MNRIIAKLRVALLTAETKNPDSKESRLLRKTHLAVANPFLTMHSLH